MEQKGKNELVVTIASLVTALTDFSGNVTPNVARFLELGLEGAKNVRLAYANNIVTFEA